MAAGKRFRAALLQARPAFTSHREFGHASAVTNPNGKDVADHCPGNRPAVTLYVGHGYPGRR